MTNKQKQALIVASLLFLQIPFIAYQLFHLFVIYGLVCIIAYCRYSLKESSNQKNLLKIDQALTENGFVYTDVTNKIRNKQGEAVPVRRLLPCFVSPNDDCLFIEPHGFGVEDFNRKRSALEMSLGITISTIQRGDKYLEIRYNRTGFPKIVNYNQIPMKRGMICKGRGLDGFEYWNISDLLHLIVFAATGGGKSVMIANMICQIYTQVKDSVCFVADFKGGQEFLCLSNLSKRIDVVTNAYCDSLQEAQKLAYERLVLYQKEMKRRQMLSAQSKVSGKSVYFPPVFIIIDEATEFFDGFNVRGKQYEYARKLASLIGSVGALGRSANFHLVVGIQKPTLDNIPPNVRTHLKSIVGGFVPNANDSITLMGSAALSNMKDEPGLLSEKMENKRLNTYKGVFVDVKNGEHRKIILRAMQKGIK